MQLNSPLGGTMPTRRWYHDDEMRIFGISRAQDEAIFPHGTPPQTPMPPPDREDFRAILFGSRGSCGVRPGPADYLPDTTTAAQ